MHQENGRTISSSPNYISLGVNCQYINFDEDKKEPLHCCKGSIAYLVVVFGLAFAIAAERIPSIIPSKLNKVFLSS